MNNKLDKLDILVKDLQEAFEWDKDYYKKVNKLMILKLFDFPVEEDDFIYVQRIVKEIKKQYKPIKKINVYGIGWYNGFDEYRIRGNIYIQRKFPYCIIDKIK